MYFIKGLIFNKHNERERKRRTTLKTTLKTLSYLVLLFIIFGYVDIEKSSVT